MNDRLRDKIKALRSSLSSEADKLVSKVSKIEETHQHKSNPTGIADEIVSAVKAIVK